MSIRRIGGLLFWRIGRLGGSFYIARRRRIARSVTEILDPHSLYNRSL